MISALITFQNRKILLQRSIDRCAVSWRLISLQTEFPGSYFIFSLVLVCFFFFFAEVDASPETVEVSGQG